MKYILNGTWINDETLMDLPEGATPLTEAEWLDRHSTPRELSTEEIKASVLARARMLRQPIMQVLDGLQASAIVTGEEVTVLVNGVATLVPLKLAIETCKQQLRDITSVDLQNYTTREQMEEVLLQTYWAIAQAAPVEVQSAFNSFV